MVSFFSKLHVDTALYEIYEDDDLRKRLFFSTVDGRQDYRGSYSGSTVPFVGLAVDELYLIKAGCLVRQGMTEAGLGVLATFLTKRYRKGTVAEIGTVGSSSDALTVVLQERRKNCF